MKKLLQSLFILMFVAGSVMAQDRTITGTVTDRTDGKPLPGVTVRLKGAVGGTQTGGNGKYSITVSKNATAIEFSYLGFLTAVRSIGSANVIDVALENDSKGLNEVVVTGYGVQTKASNTGAQASIKGEQLANVPNANVAASLQGKLPGLMVLGNSGKPGDPPFLRVRGTSSITGGNQPLILVDGVDAPNLNSVNPNDIENATLLKDPSSTAIYGSRAANGVLLITTKKGKMGEAKFTYDFQSGIRKRNKDNFDLMNIPDKLQYEFDAKFQNDQLKSAVNAGITAGKYPANSSIFTIPVADRNAMWSTLEAVNHDWADDLFRKGKVQSHQLGLSGATEKMTYYFNLNRYTEDGIAFGSSFKRTGGRLNTEYKAKEWLKVGTSITGAYTSDTNVRESYNVLSPFGSFYFLNSYEPLRLPNGNYNPTNQGLNPIQSILDAPAIANRVYASGNAFADITPIENLLVRSSIGMNYTKTAAETFYVPGSPVDAAIFGTAAPGYKDDNGNENFFYIWSNTASYSKKIADDHELNGLIGFEYLQSKGTAYQFNSKGYPSKDTYYSTQNNGARPNSVTSSRTAWTQVSYFGKLGYNYKQKYFADASIRRDGSSRFGTDNRFGTFWSAGVAWNAIKEDFIQEAMGSVVDQLKVRASVGTTGNNQIGNFDSQGVYSFGKYNGQSVIGETVLGNANLSWEDNTAYNIGLEFAMFNNRLRGSFDYYERYSKNLLYRVPKSQTTGFTSRLENAAELSNKGVEFSIDGDVIRNDDFTWNLSFNISNNKNKVEKLYGDVKELPGAYTTLKVGLPVNTYYLTRWAGIDPQTGEEMFYDKNGNTFSDVTKVGANQVALNKSANPKYFGTIGTSVAYKSLTLSASLFYNYGNYIYNIVWRDLVNQGNDPSTPQAADALNYWRKPGDVVKYKAPVAGAAQPDAVDKYLQKGDYIRLRDVMLSYDLPKQWINKVKLQNVRVYLQGTNLFTHASDYKGDPEVGTGNNERTDQPGVLSLYPYTPSRAFTFGASITF
ncbi:TonB-dependent receptor [Pedobacter gandavensis]|uniref:SusC/RagA family TonB-linked outer membrane protein n=1 Tax=Pedobacter gandavensis TaxID=2679963 RepID=UPI00292F461E|nr:TonB-dependent receptor [Pedobacter gandavensis]